MFPAREHLCMALPSGPPTPLFPAVSPYPCPAYRSPVCLPGYIPSHLIAWKTAHPHRGSGSKSPFVRVVKARKRNSFSIESLLSEDKFEVSDDKEPQLRRGPLPIVASQIQKGGSSSHVAEFNVWKNAVQGRDDGGIPNKDALYVVHNFEDMVKHYRGTMTVSDNSDISGKNFIHSSTTIIAPPHPPPSSYCPPVKSYTDYLMLSSHNQLQLMSFRHH